jgi:hypothetical protein
VNVHARNAGVALGTLLASGATLVCCVLPAVMVSLGAGATLVTLLSAAPQLVWLSEYKSVVFAVAGLMLTVGGVLLWRARRLPCPADARVSRQCARLRRISAGVYGLALAAFVAGVLFAWVLPLLDA